VRRRQHLVVSDADDAVVAEDECGRALEDLVDVPRIVVAGHHEQARGAVAGRPYLRELDPTPDVVARDLGEQLLRVRGAAIDLGPRREPRVVAVEADRRGELVELLAVADDALLAEELGAERA